MIAGTAASVVGPGRGRRPPPPTVQEAKAALLAESQDPPLVPLLALDWITRNPIVSLVGAGVGGVVLARSKLLRRGLVAALIGPGVRRFLIRQAAEIIGVLRRR